MADPAFDESDLITSLSDTANRMISHFHELDVTSAPTVEPAVVTPFWAEGDLINISSLPGCGKTAIAADMIIAATVPEREGKALGGLFRFNHDLLKLGKVAVIDAESGIARWQSTIRRKLANEGLDQGWNQQQVLHIAAQHLDLSDPSQWTKRSVALAEALSACNVRFFIGDTSARIWAPEEVNSSAWVQRGLAPFRDACRKYGITGVMLTHTRRPSGEKGSPPLGPIGSSFQEGQADGQIMLSRNESQGRHGLQLSHLKNRRAYWIQRGSSVQILFTKEYGYEPIGDYASTWPHEPPDEDTLADQYSDTTSAKILSLLREAFPEPLKSPAIADQLGITDRTVRRHLNRQKMQRKVSRSGHGPNTRWQAVAGEE